MTPNGGTHLVPAHEAQRWQAATETAMLEIKRLKAEIKAYRKDLRLANNTIIALKKRLEKR